MQTSAIIVCCCQGSWLRSTHAAHPGRHHGLREVRQAPREDIMTVLAHLNGMYIRTSYTIDLLHARWDYSFILSEHFSSHSRHMHLVEEISYIVEHLFVMIIIWWLVSWIHISSIKKVTLDSASYSNPQGVTAHLVEQCTCPQGYVGHSCEVGFGMQLKSIGVSSDYEWWFFVDIYAL